MNRYILCLFVIFTISGCVNKNEIDAGGQKLSVDDFVPNFLHMDQCAGTHLTQSYLPGQNPADLPPGWNDSEDSDTSIRMMIWTCTLIGLDEIERPATILFEIAGGLSPPKDCLVDANGNPYLLINLLSDDQDLINVLNDKYHMNAKLAHFEILDTLNGKYFQWVVDYESSVQVFFSRPITANDEQTYRVLWDFPKGSGIMDIYSNYSTAYLVYQPAIGEIRSPHYMGVAGTFAGIVSIDQEGTLSGEIQLKGEKCS